VADHVGDINIIHLAGKPTADGDQYCVICGKLLCVSSKTYLEGEDVLEQRRTKSKTLFRKEYIRCTELS
jgi:hypothetical protein